MGAVPPLHSESIGGEMPGQFSDADRAYLTQLVGQLREVVGAMQKTSPQEQKEQIMTRCAQALTEGKGVNPQLLHAMDKAFTESSAGAFGISAATDMHDVMFFVTSMTAALVDVLGPLSDAASALAQAQQEAEELGPDRLGDFVQLLSSDLLSKIHTSLG